MTDRTQQFLLRASELLDEEASCLFDSHTVNGEWFITDKADASAKQTHDEMKQVAAALRSLPSPDVAGLDEVTEEMLRAALDVRYQRSKRNQRVKATYPNAYETWMRFGLKEDAPAIAEEYKAMRAAAPTRPATEAEVIERCAKLCEQQSVYTSPQGYAALLRALAQSGSGK